MSLRPMIGMPYKNLLGTIELFNQHTPHQQVRPRHATKGNKALTAVPDKVTQTVS
ncbi:MAG: hypothetical protein K0R76_1652, partial [Alphaproteobacteria bacterium]|nr:hypothetical protein [Alphaproteobacteria bacterium]